MTGPVWVFDEFELDAARFELRRAGARVPIQPKALDLLLYLARHPDRVVTKDELLAALWPDAIVTEASLSRAVNAARQALDDGGRTQRCIETVRGRGFRFVAAIVDRRATGELPLPTPFAQAEIEDDSGFVGRAEILDQIGAVLEASERGSGGMILLAGEPGMGKTRTAQEATRRASRRVRRLWGWCQEGNGAPPFWPWLVILREAIGDLDATTLAERLGEGASDLATLLPIVREHLPDLAPPPTLAGEQLRFRLFDAVNEFLKQTCREHPLLLVLDDVHWADRASLELLRFLSHGLSDLPILVLATYRDEELRGAHLLFELSRRPGCHSFRLAGLDRDEVVRFIALELGEPPDETVGRAIHEATEGNPFFVRECTRLLASEGRLEDFARRGGRVPLPSGVREVLRQRLDRLSSECRDALKIGATIGRDFELRVVARVQELGAEQALELLDEACAARLLRPVEEGYRFSHALVQEALLEGVPAAERARCHRRIGETLQLLHRDHPERHLAQIAHHLCAGIASGGAEQAVEYARRAGERAARALNHDEAAQLFQRAIDAQDDLEERDDASCCRLLIALGEAQMGSGQAETGRTTLRRAAELARSIGAPEELARAALAFGGLELATEVGVYEPELVRMLEEALVVLPDADTALRARLLARLAIAVYWGLGNSEKSSARSREALAVARRLGDPTPLGYALHSLRFSLLGPDDLPLRLDDAEEMLRLAQELRNPELELAAHSWRMIDLIELGRIPEADRELAAYAALASSLRVPRYHWRIPLYRAMRALLDGRFAEAEELTLRALAEEQSLGLGDQGLASTGQLATLRWEQGRLAELEPAIKSMVERFPSLPVWRTALALCHVEIGRIADARVEFEALAADDFYGLTDDFLRLTSLASLALVCAFLGDAPRARLLYARLRPYAPRTLVMGFGVACWGALDRFLGILATTARDWEAAVAHLRAALAMNARIGARAWVGWTEHDLGRLYLERGRPGDLERARAHLVRARETATALGMARLAERAADPSLRLD